MSNTSLEITRSKIRPTKRYPFVAPPNKSSWISRSVKAMLIEHRIPNALERRIDAVFSKIGFVYKTKLIKELLITFRRCTADEAFVQNVFIDEEYFSHGYIPRKGDTIIDIGANIGCFTLAAARYARRGKIIAIEPFPTNVHLLQQNITQNKINNAVILEAAVTTHTGEIELYIGNDTGMHSVKFDVGRGTVKVPSIRLEDIFVRQNIEICNFLKIDCEGAEFEFLPKLDSTHWKCIERIAMEFSVPVLDWVYHNPTNEQIALKLQYGNELVQLLERHEFIIDAYIDCVGFRAGYIFARNANLPL